MTLNMQSDPVEAIDWIGAPEAASILGYKDGRTAIRLAELGELTALRSPGRRARWRFDRASVEAARDRYTRAERIAS